MEPENDTAYNMPLVAAQAHHATARHYFAVALGMAHDRARSADDKLIGDHVFTINENLLVALYFQNQATLAYILPPEVTAE
jgi:hypothetical protein